MHRLLRAPPLIRVGEAVCIALLALLPVLIKNLPESPGDAPHHLGCFNAAITATGGASKWVSRVGEPAAAIVLFGNACCWGRWGWMASEATLAHS